MSRLRRNYDRRFDLGLALRKMFVSGFVIFTFIAYVIDQQFNNIRQTLRPGINQSTSALSGQSPAQPGAAMPQGPGSSSLAVPQPQTFLQPQPTPAPSGGGQYKDGTYTGDQADALYGVVQVKVVIANGKLANVQIMDYPHDRRTSQFINSQALPWLTTEAIQAQSANVDLISGATLTSEAFIESLQTALANAKG